MNYLDNGVQNAAETNRNYSFSIKNKLNIKEEGRVKLNKHGGEIIAVSPGCPIEAYLDDLLFIITIPNPGQDRAPCYIRLQDRDRMADRCEIQQFSEIHATGHLKQKVGQFIVCAVDTHVKVKLTQLVVIATIPTDGRTKAPVYIKPRTPKSEAYKARIIVDNRSDDFGDVDDLEVEEDSGFNS